MHTELRVHGVSGTPPRNMLYTDPVVARSCPPDDGHVTVLEHPVIDHDTRAYHWGGLTSGSRASAAWIVLGPFMLANVAGWMSRRIGYWSAASSRLAGLGITALFAAQAATAGVAIPATAMLDGPAGGWAGPVLAGITFLLGAGFVFVVTFFVARSNTPDDYASRVVTAVSAPQPSGVPSGDPARGVLSRRITSGEFLVRQRVFYALQRCHVGIGLSVMALAAAAAAGGTVGRSEFVDLAFTVALATSVFLVMLVVLVGAGPFWQTLTGSAFWVGASSLGLTVAAVAGSDIIRWEPSAVHDVVTVTSLVVGLIVVVGVLPLCGWASTGALTLSAQMVGVLGVGFILVIERLLRIESDSRVVAFGAGWVAVAMLLVIELLVGWAAVAMMRRPPPGLEVADGWSGALRRIVLRSREAMVLAGAAGVVAAGVAAGRVVGALGDDTHRLAEALGTPSQQTTLGVLIATAVVAVLVLAACTRRRLLSRRVIAIGTVVGIVLAAGVLVAVRLFESIPSVGLVEAATWLVVVVPGSFVVSSVVRGYRDNDGESRRKVGILWDLGSFWPRWYHPLAPPDYGAHVVRCLRNELSQHPVKVLSGHSQGSLVAAMALHHGDSTAGFVSYGSQLGWLYPNLFPAVGFTDLREMVGERRRWINLLRSSDPIGGHPVGELGAAGNRIAGGSGHSRYELTEEFGEARDLVMEG